MTTRQSRMATFREKYLSALALLAEGKAEDARHALHGYLPCMGPLDFDFALYCVEDALILPSTWRDGGTSSPMAPVLDLFQQARATDRTQFVEFLKWFRTQTEEIGCQQHNADAFRDLYLAVPDLPDVSPIRANDTIGPSLLAEQYKNIYEINYPLDALANLFHIRRGNGFRNRPYAGMEYHGTAITDRHGDVKKGLALRWLADQSSDPNLTQLIGQAYDSAMRNILGGHNDYSYNEETQSYEELRGGSSFTMSQVRETTRALDALQQVIIVQSGLHLYRQGVLPGPDFSNFGNMDVRWLIDGSPVREIVVVKYWGNYREIVQWPDCMTFAPSPIRWPGHCSISLCIGREMCFPYDLRILANKNTLAMLRDLRQVDEISLRTLAVSPPIPSLADDEVGRISVAGSDLSVLADSSRRVGVDRDFISQTIEYVEKTL